MGCLKIKGEEHINILLLLMAISESRYLPFVSLKSWLDEILSVLSCKQS